MITIQECRTDKCGANKQKGIILLGVKTNQGQNPYHKRQKCGQ